MLKNRVPENFLIAGLSVAQAVQKSFDIKKNPNVLICVGPGKKDTLLMNHKLTKNNNKKVITEVMGWLLQDTCITLDSNLVFIILSNPKKSFIR